VIGNEWKVAPLYDRFTTAIVSSSIPAPLTTSYCRQNLHNDCQALSVCLVALRTVFKNLSPIQDPRSRFF
jgi:hypothetical protein